MLARLALVGVLVLTTGTQAAPAEAPAPAALAPVSRASVAGNASLSSATATLAAAEPVEGVSFTEVDLVVPAVEPGGELTELGAPGDSEAVVADVVLGDRVETAVVETEGFQTLGVTWPQGADVEALEPEVRTRNDGEWSDWLHLELSDGAPDAGTPDADREVRGGTDPVWVGEADAVQLSFAATSDGGPDDLRLALVDSEDVPTPAADTILGLDAGDFDAGNATFGAGLVPAVAPVPSIISRAQWGAAPQVCTPSVASTLVGAVLHHTAGSNAYSTVDQAMQQIRNDQRYHIEGRGWCDIGYNYIVDKWGNIYEGRANSGTAPVVGVHAGGFNTGTVGISMLGSYGTVWPSSATQESVARVVAWRLGQYHRNPAGTLVYRTLGGENSKYPAGADVSLPVLFSHRDVGNTACPGELGYQTLTWLRDRARQLIGTSFINPSASPVSFDPGSTVTLRAATFNNINWRLEVTHAVSGTPVAASTGYAQQALGGVVATWDGRDTAGRAVGIGAYRLTLTGTDAASGAAVVPYSTTVQVWRDPNPPVVDPVPLVGDLTFIPLTPHRLLDTRESGVPVGPRSRLDLVVTGTAGVPADAKAVAVNVTVVSPSAVTYVQAWPAGQARPNASVLNGDAGRSASAAGVTLGVGGEGKISLYNGAGSAHLVVDVAGYYTTGSGLGYAQLTTATRILDTRVTGGTMTNGQRRSVTVAGRGGIPADATAVAMNVTSVRSSGNGNVAVVPAGTANPQTSSVNHLPGQDVANLTTVPLASGAVDVLLSGSSANVVLDVVGWFGPGTTGRFTPIVPVRAFDTRLSGGPLGHGASRPFAVSSPAGLPASATSALMTLTATQQSSPVTYLTTWPAGSTLPSTSNLNTGYGRDQANSAVVGLGTGGAVAVFNSLGSTHIIGDVFGYYD